MENPADFQPVLCNFINLVAKTRNEIIHNPLPFANSYMKTINIKTENNSSITATVYNGKQNHHILIIASATGVKQSFYKKFSEFISENNITVITFDYQGIGLSLERKIKELQNNAQDWGSVDLENVIKYIKEKHPNSKISIIGHSIGGQLIGIAKSSTEIHKVILVATQSGYWKFWKGFERIKMWLNWYILFPSLIKVFGYMPSEKLSGMENLPKNVAKQWSNWGRKSEYLFSEIHPDLLYFDQIRSKITAISIENDSFAPKEAVDWFTQKYKNAEIKQIHLKPNDYNTKNIGHFGIFKEKHKKDIWKLLLDEIKE